MSIQTDRVVVTTVVAVDPETAFSVFTERVDAWWKHGPRFRTGVRGASSMRFEPGVGGRLLEIFDTAVELEADERSAVVNKSGYQYMKAHEDVFEMAAPTFFSAGGTFFVSGKSGNDRCADTIERERIASFCREALKGASYPLAHYYPDLLEPGR